MTEELRDRSPAASIAEVLADLQATSRSRRRRPEERSTTVEPMRSPFRANDDLEAALGGLLSIASLVDRHSDDLRHESLGESAHFGVLGDSRGQGATAASNEQVVVFAHDPGRAADRFEHLYRARQTTLQIVAWLARDLSLR